MMKLYNTLSRKKEDFKPINQNQAKIYICGPTVYNFIHIGNARPFVVFDVLHRYLLDSSYKVEYIQNLTDIDDKIILEANKSNLDFSQISEKFINEFFVDIKGLNILKATAYPKVSEEIPGIIKMIEELIGKGYAYEVGGSVYFRAELAKEYGKLSKKNTDDLEFGARVLENSDKENPVDFVLWKNAKEGEPSWQSPWGAGRPGWHIECSFMAGKYLGKTIDIHAGGEDLCFPHHENEIAQSEAHNSAPLANYWLHNGMLLLNDSKMAKSAGNALTVRQLSEKFGYMVLRFFLLSAHYRAPMNFSEDLLASSESSLKRIENCIALLERENGEFDNAEQINQSITNFKAALDDDLNTANAIACLFDFIRYVNSNAKQINAKKSLDALNYMLSILGLDLTKEVAIDEAVVADLINQRQLAKEAKNWQKADEIRQQLSNMGIEIKDTREGTIWSVK